MILTLGLGESSYVPDALVGMLQDRVDLDLIALWQCYGRDPLRWEVLLFFADHAGWYTSDSLAAELGMAPELAAKKLVELTDDRLVKEDIPVTGPVYQMAEDRALCRVLRRLGQKFLSAVAKPL